MVATTVIAIVIIVALLLVTIIHFFAFCHKNASSSFVIHRKCVLQSIGGCTNKGSAHKRVFEVVVFEDERISAFHVDGET